MHCCQVERLACLKACQTKRGFEAGVDVIFIDCPENLLVPGLSKLPHVVPTWNADPDNEALQLMCSFAAEHLYDDGCIILFHSNSRKSKENIAGVSTTLPCEREQGACEHGAWSL